MEQVCLVEQEGCDVLIWVYVQSALHVQTYLMPQCIRYAPAFSLSKRNDLSGRFQIKVERRLSREALDILQIPLGPAFVEFAMKEEVCCYSRRLSDALVFDGRSFPAVDCLENPLALSTVGHNAHSNPQDSGV